MIYIWILIHRDGFLLYCCMYSLCTSSYRSARWLPPLFSPLIFQNTLLYIQWICGKCHTFTCNQYVSDECYRDVCSTLSYTYIYTHLLADYYILYWVKKINQFQKLMCWMEENSNFYLSKNNNPPELFMGNGCMCSDYVKYSIRFRFDLRWRNNWCFLLSVIVFGKLIKNNPQKISLWCGYGCFTSIMDR